VTSNSLTFDLCFDFDIMPCAAASLRQPVLELSRNAPSTKSRATSSTGVGRTQSGFGQKPLPQVLQEQHRLNIKPATLGLGLS